MGINALFLRGLQGLLWFNNVKMISSSLLLQGDVLRAGLLVLHFLLRAQHQVIVVMLMMMMMNILSRVGETFHASQPSITVDGFTDPSQGDRWAKVMMMMMMTILMKLRDSQNEKIRIPVLRPTMLFVDCICQNRGVTGLLLKWRNGIGTERGSMKLNQNLSEWIITKNLSLCPAEAKIKGRPLMIQGVSKKR